MAECLQQLEVLGLVSSDLPLLHFMQRLLGAVIQAQSLVVKNDPLSILDQKSFYVAFPRLLGGKRYLVVHNASVVLQRLAPNSEQTKAN